MGPKTLQVYPFNRVEGDLEVQLEMDGDLIRDAYSSGTMYRGFENIMKGRAPLDGLVITPRICGICTTAHLAAAAKALDRIAGVEVPDSAVRIRNITAMSEQVQNDVRHHVMLFMPDTTRPVYADHALFREAGERYTPLRGRSVLETVRESKRLLEIIAILGGQWPHSSFMVPGGVVSVLSAQDIVQCRYVLQRFRQWYETFVLGCPLEVWSGVRTAEDLDGWLRDAEAHRDGEVGFFVRFAREAGFSGMGAGPGNFLSCGTLDMPGDTEVAAFGPGGHYLPAGFWSGGQLLPFDQEKITEDVCHSWLSGYDGGLHPSRGLTEPYATGAESPKYSWAKAPRYDGRPAETGPLAQMVVGGVPLVRHLVEQEGPGVFVRQLARLVRPALLLPVLDRWLAESAEREKRFLNNVPGIKNGEGYGLVEAPRGFLGHWVSIKDGRIDRYQVIPPSTWNASPRDAAGTRGPWEEALVGTRVRDPRHPAEADHIIRSFDPCLVCSVHCVDPEGRPRR